MTSNSDPRAGRTEPISDRSSAATLSDGGAATCLVDPAEIAACASNPKSDSIFSFPELRPAPTVLASKLIRAHEAMPKVGDDLFGFQLLEVLGEGSFATVFLASQPQLADRLVALKVSRVFEAEPRNLARLQHSNIVPIHSVHRAGVLQAVCMPYLGSVTLSVVLRDIVRTGLPPQSGQALLYTLQQESTRRSHRSDAELKSSLPGDAIEATHESTPILELLANSTHINAMLWLAARLADGLQHAHERGLLHLDLKPANILLTNDGQPMLLDFNLAIDVGRDESVDLALVGGTLPYMSPEQFESFKTRSRMVDARSDLFSLGVILYQLLTGRSPYASRGGATQLVVPLMHRDRQTPPSPPGKLNTAISPAVDAIVLKLLDPDPKRRYQTAGDLREDLDRQLANLPLHFAPEPSVVERFRKWRRRRPRTATACLVGLAALLLVVVPTTVIAVRQNQIAERKMQIEIAEARQQWHDLSREARAAQLLLATRVGDRDLLNRGLERGRHVVDAYGISVDRDWAQRPVFARLPADQQAQARQELGELLLFMARAEQIKATDAAVLASRIDGFRAALRWNQAAAACYPGGHVPRLLARQRDELLQFLPGEAEALAVGAPSEMDGYHDGVLRATEGRYRDALASLRTFTDNHPQHFQAWFVRGLCHESIGQNADAAAAYTTCIALEPDTPWAYYNRGLIRLQQQDPRGADADFGKAIARGLDIAPMRMNRAIARKGIPDYDGALDDLNVILGRADAPARAWFLRAEIRELANDKAGAQRDRDQGLRTEPRDELSWSTRGYSRMNREPAEALRDFDRALAINPRSRDALLNKSYVLADVLERPREGLQVLDQFLEYYPDHVSARAGHGVMLARLGECEKARADARACLRGEPTPVLHYQLACLYAQLARHEKEPAAKDEALRCLARAIRTGFANAQLFTTDPDLEPIRSDAEYKRLVAVVVGLQKSAAK